ncbi:MAG: ATP-binding protein [Oligoflexia bacterium]|nr:ATP-binding protein [Oligoflexia bacterium]
MSKPPPASNGLADFPELQGELALAQRSIAGSLGQIVLAAIFLAFTAFPKSRPLFSWTLLSVIFASNLLRLYLGVRQARFYPDNRRTWIALFGPTVWLPALCWGTLFHHVIRREGLNSFETTLSLLIGSGISASIITSISPDRRLAQAFFTFVLGIPLLALIQRMEAQATGLALIFITYYAFLSFQLKIHHQSFWESAHNRQRLIEQHSRLKAVMDAIPGLVAWIGPDLRFRGVNRSYALNFSGTAEEFIGKGLEYKNPDAEFVAAITEFARSGARRLSKELKLTIGEARQKRCHLLVMSRTEANSDSALAEEIYLICIDIQELKEARSELEQQRLRSELTSKLAALGEISANTAHEIRNPLTTVTTSMQLLQRHLKTGPPDAALISDIGERVLATCARMNKIIDNLRGYTRRTEGEPYVETHLGSIVENSVDLIEHHFRANQVALVVDPIDEKISILCHPVELSQVLVNLLHNAFDAARSQPERWVRLNCETTPDEALLRVIDSGRGIPDEIANRMFTPFFTTKPLERGTGLGLSISRRIIQQHRGTLVLERSAPNTTFVIRLPLASAKKAPAPRAA